MSQREQDAKKAASSRLTGWIFAAAGVINVAASLSTNNPLMAVGAVCFFTGAIIFFLRAKKLHPKP